MTINKSATVNTFFNYQLVRLLLSSVTAPVKQVVYKKTISISLEFNNRLNLG